MAQALGISRAEWAAVRRLVGAGTSAGAAPGGGGGRGGATDSMILIRNDTGAELSRGHIVGLDGLVNTPETNARDWDFYLYYKAVKPDPEQFPFAIVMEETAPDKSGYAMIYGVRPVRVDVKDKEHKFAKPVKSDPQKMESSEAGPARLLYRRAESGVTEGLIHFPVGATSASPPVLARIQSISSSGKIAVAPARLLPEVDWTAATNWTWTPETRSAVIFYGTGVAPS